MVFHHTTPPCPHRPIDLFNRSPFTEKQLTLTSTGSQCYRLQSLVNVCTLHPALRQFICKLHSHRLSYLSRYLVTFMVNIIVHRWQLVSIDVVQQMISHYGSNGPQFLCHWDDSLDKGPSQIYRQFRFSDSVRWELYSFSSAEHETVVIQLEDRSFWWSLVTVRMVHAVISMEEECDRFFHKEPTNAPSTPFAPGLDVASCFAVRYHRLISR